MPTSEPSLERAQPATAALAHVLPSSSDPTALWVQTVEEMVNKLKFGLVQITVHDGKVVQVEKNERVRFDLSKSGKSAAVR